MTWIVWKFRIVWKTLTLLEDLQLLEDLEMLEDLDTGTTGNPRYWKHHKHRIFGNTEFLKTLVTLDIKDFGGPEYLHI